MQDIATLISTMGFPIVAFLLLFFKLYNIIEMLQTAVNNNTLALQKLLDREEKRNGKD